MTGKGLIDLGITKAEIMIEKLYDEVEDREYLDSKFVKKELEE